MVITELEQIRHSVAVTSDPFETLRSRLAGQVLTAGSAAYDKARRTVSIKVDRHPLAIVRRQTLAMSRQRSILLATAPCRWRYAAVATAWPTSA